MFWNFGIIRAAFVHAPAHSDKTSQADLSAFRWQLEIFSYIVYFIEYYRLCAIALESSTVATGNTVYS